MTLFGLPVCIFHTLRNIAAMVFFAVFANQRLFVKTMYILPIHTSSLFSPQMIFRTLATVVVAIFAVEVVRADMYLHNMRGSNNRLDEARRDRNNANRYVCIQHSLLFLFPFEKKCFFFSWREERLDSSECPTSDAFTRKHNRLQHATTLKYFARVLSPPLSV